ncbi:MAG: DUF4367 domain-containing protein [Candidatus Methanoperedens sp.]
MNKMIVIISIFAIISTVLFAGCVEMSAEQIASEMQNKMENIKDYKGTIYTKMSFEGLSRESESDFKYSMPDKSWSKTTTGDGDGDISVFNGTTMWLYNSTKNEVTIMDIPKRETDKPDQVDYVKIVKNMLEQNDVQMSGSEKIDGRETFILEMMPKNKTQEAFMFKQKLWVDKETWMPLRMETYDKDGKLIMSMEYRNVEFNTGIPDSEFEFKIPDGAKVVTREMTLPKEVTLDEARNSVNFSVAVPSYLPEGYILDRVTVFEYDTTQSVSITYKNGEEALSVYEVTKSAYTPNGKFETVKINGVEARYKDSDFGRTLSWPWKGSDISVYGKISKEELIKVAESII